MVDFGAAHARIEDAMSDLRYAAEVAEDADDARLVVHWLDGARAWIVQAEAALAPAGEEKQR